MCITQFSENSSSTGSSANVCLLLGRGSKLGVASAQWIQVPSQATAVSALCLRQASSICFNLSPIIDTTTRYLSKLSFHPRSMLTTMERHPVTLSFGSEPTYEAIGPSSSACPEGSVPLHNLCENCRRWAQRHWAMDEGLEEVDMRTLRAKDHEEHFVSTVADFLETSQTCHLCIMVYYLIWEQSVSRRDFREHCAEQVLKHSGNPELRFKTLPDENQGYSLHAIVIGVERIFPVYLSIFPFDAGQF